jgi:hypothetical protein
MSASLKSRYVIERTSDAGARSRAHLTVLWKLLGRKIQFHPSFMRITDSATASLMLSQAFYWTRTWLNDRPELDGWFHKRTEDWQNETGLTRKEQETARKVLRNTGFMDERRQGMPAQLHYQINLEHIVGAIQPSPTPPLPQSFDWNDEVAIFELLGRPIVFHRHLVDVTGSTTAALMLSHCISQTSRILAKRPDGWFWKTQDDWHKEIGLSRWEMDTARAKLRDLGLLEEKRVAIATHDASRIIHYKINLHRLEQTISELRAGENTSKVKQIKEEWKTGNQVCGIPAICTVENGQSSMRDSRNLYCGKRAICTVENGQSSMRDSRNLYCGKRAICTVENGQSSMSENLTTDCPKTTLLYKEAVITTENIKLQQQPFSQISSSQAAHPPECGGGELIYPKQILPELREAIGQRLLAHTTPSIAQQVLDVLANAYQQPKGVSNPVALAAALLKKIKEGSFDPLPGLQIALQRKRGQEIQAVLEERRKAIPDVFTTESAGMQTPQTLPDKKHIPEEAREFIDRFLKKPSPPAPTAQNTRAGLILLKPGSCIRKR